MASQLAMLAPRPEMKAPPLTKRKPNLPIHHSDQEWTAAYPHIERMYVKERRKLRYVMETMEQEYNFKATLQMYKKRFTKWGFSKNKPRTSSKTTPSRDSSTSPPSCTAVTKPIPKRTTHTVLPTSIKLGDLDMTNLEFLTSIQNWSTSFFESALSDPSSPSRQIPPLLPVTQKGSGQRYDPEELSFAFRVVIELLRRGKGVLAGRLTRKAFLQIEAMLQIEGPLFIWNLMEILYNIARLEQTQLFEVLLFHLMGLARNLFAPEHPAMQILYSLRKLAEGWRRDSLPPQVPVLEQAWAINANTVFSNFDSRMLLLYYRLVWDSALVRLPQDRLHDADRWFTVLEDKVPRGHYFLEDTVACIHPDLISPSDAEAIEPPKDYEILKHTSLSAIQHRSTLDFTGASIRVRVLSGLLKSRILEESPPPPSASDAPRDSVEMSRLHARIIAYVMKILVEVDWEMGFDSEITTERLRSIISMREYGQSPIGPQTIFEWWQLEAILLREGHREEALEIRKETYKRLEKYLDDVPVHEI
ncbi:hypothetical protein FDECE_7364 [Fusarium decemcellulare]|nr:hypothetical protein FDECE_7364 [Fusarium decemcellulare]